MSKPAAKHVIDSAQTAPAAEKIYGVSRDDLARLIAVRHADPHSILGAHATARGVVVRAFRPDAANVTLITDDDRYPMVARGGGLFDLRCADRREVFPYSLEIHPVGGEAFVSR